MDVSSAEFNELLTTGWRRFGIYFFRPVCGSCFECRPIRVDVNNYKPSKSHKRILKKNSKTEVFFKHLTYSHEIYEIYLEHSKDRFNQESSEEDFYNTFYHEAVPAMQSEYYLDNKLIAVGFMDLSTEALSSVYFIYKTAYNYLSPGNFSIIKEIEFAKFLGLNYYYLGYYIKDNQSMAYKNRFNPYQIYDWKKQIWNPEKQS